VRYRVLVIDDYPDAATAVSTLLAALGHEVRSAMTGRAGIEVARTFEPDIALVDIGLPDISGHDVARTLRELAGTRPLFLAAISGWGQPEDRASSLAAGFDHHALKPIDAGIIKRILTLASARTAR